MLRRIVPHPLGTTVLALFWLLIAGTLEPAHLLLALVVGLVLPPLLERFGPPLPRIARWDALWRLGWVVLYDIVIANITVARLILGPIGRLRSRFVEVPLDTDHPHVNTFFASIITMTPGTVSCDVDLARRVIVVHALDLDDPQSAIAGMKSRYEAPLKEIFGC